MKALCYGEILWDIIGGAEYLGGAVFNLAAHLARCGADSFMVSRLGSDERGERTLEQMSRLDVGASHVQVDPERPTGTVEVTLSQGGQPSYQIHRPVAFDFIEIDERRIERLQAERADALCLGTLVQRSETSRNSLRRILEQLQTRHVFYDVNLRRDGYCREWIEQSLSRATMLKLNEEEAAVVSKLIYGSILSEKEFAQQVSQDHDLDVVVITQGSRGCRVFDGGALHQCPGRRVEVADTVGAGDAFGAAFLCKFCSSGDPIEAGEVANALGAFVASSRGAIPEYTPQIRQVLTQYGMS